MPQDQPKPAREMVSVRIPKEMNARFEKHVQGIGVTKSAFILMLLAKELKEEVTQ